MLAMVLFAAGLVAPFLIAGSATPAGALVDYAAAAGRIERELSE